MDFDKLFAILTGHKPFPWQRRLYEDFCKGNSPAVAVCDIPTGLGKTSVIALWALALAGKEPSVQLPRRLVYVVNRRTIVDQSTEVAVELRRILHEAEQNSASPLHGTAKALRDMCAVGNGDLLSVSTLRGELADNLEWRFDPMRPAVIIGTVDMIGSKLLFSGYGDTRRVRPLNAGLIGCDTLIVHDEAHLTPAFSHLLRSVENYRHKGNAVAGIPPFRVLELSATSRQATGKLFAIDHRDYGDATIRSRLFAKKTLYLHKVEKTGNRKETFMKLTLMHYEKRSRVVVFVRSPEEAAQIHDQLVKELIHKEEEKWRLENNTATIPTKERNILVTRCKEAVSILSGEIRGYERDKLLETKGIRPFTGKTAAEQTVYLIATSAGEVGMDLHADHMVSDLSTLDSMIQRLGQPFRPDRITCGCHL